jgi:hypothetical protein
MPSAAHRSASQYQRTCTHRRQDHVLEPVYPLGQVRPIPNEDIPVGPGIGPASQNGYVRSQHLAGRTEPDIADILLEPVLIRNREGGQTVWMPDNYANKIKLLYLARLREYTPLAADEDAERLLRSSRVSTSVFDRWWSIRRLEVENDTEELVHFLKRVQDKVDPPNDEYVAGWLERVSGGVNQPLHLTAAALRLFEVQRVTSRRGR